MIKREEGNLGKGTQRKSVVGKPTPTGIATVEERKAHHHTKHAHWASKSRGIGGDTGVRQS